MKDGLGWGQQRPHHSESDLSVSLSTREGREGLDGDGRGRVGGGKGVKEGEGWEQQQRPHHSESDL